jgi:hypothetical protein
MSPILLAALLSLPALASAPVADFSGHWAATEGKVSSPIPGLSGDCTRLELVIEQDAARIETKKYSAACALFSSDWGPVAQTIRDGKVYEGDKQVGTIDATTMITVAQDGNVAYAYNLRLGADAEGAYLDTYYGTKNAVGSVVIEARLRKTR